MIDSKKNEADELGVRKIELTMPQDALVGCTLEGNMELKPFLSGLKICLIATVPYFMVSQLKSQAEYLKEMGMRVFLVSSDGPELSQINIGDGLSVKTINIQRPFSPVLDLVTLVRLVCFFLKNRFDIVHSTTPKAGILTALGAFCTCVPIRLHTFTGQPWVTLQGTMRWATRAADKLIGFLNTKCYADSQSQAKFLVSEGVVASRKMATIGHGSLAGVDMKRFNPDRWSLSMKQDIRRDLSISESSRVLLFIGRITPDKGITELIAAFYELLSMDHDVDLLIVGPHDKDCGGVGFLDLKEIMQCSRIHLTGYTEFPEKYLAIADIFCLPSYREGFGTVVIEAAAMGVPTVGTAIYGLTDAVVDGETGILVPPRDERALFKALKHLLDHPDTLCNMGKKARARCIECFDSGIVNEKVAQEYMLLSRKA